jgi:hypothetical protein
MLRARKFLTSVRPMIKGLHGLFYTSEPEAMRDFIKNKLKLPHTDVGDGWLIFDLPEGDLGVHPTEKADQSGVHDVSFYCEDIQGTVKDLKKRGVAFDMDIADHGYGFVTYFTMPGGVKVQLYEPKYTKARAAKPKAKARAKPKARARVKPTRRARR